jgi:hypothetical protein
MKANLGLNTADETPLFVTQQGEALSNSVLAANVALDFKLSGCTFNATPNRIRHSVTTIVSEYNILYMPFYADLYINVFLDLIIFYVSYEIIFIFY